MSNKRIIELLLKVIKLVLVDDLELTVAQAMALIPINKELKVLRIDLLEHLK